MTIASKHFDPYLGIDIHMTVIAPSPVPVPIPTPHIGMVLDPFDYVPLIGATVEVDGVKRGTAGTGGMCVHIPLGVWTPSLRQPMGPQWMDDEVFMGSRTVLADGGPFSRLAEPVLDCSFVGMVPPIRKKAKKDLPLSMVLPTAVNLSIPSSVMIGGPSTVNLMALGFRAGLESLGRLRKTDFYKARMEAFADWRRTRFKDLPSSMLKCNILRAGSVDIRDGSVVVAHEDFALPGRLPLAWVRHYASRDVQETGVCGPGWRTPADIRLELGADGSVLLVGPQLLALFPGLPDGVGVEGTVMGFINGARLSRVVGAQGEELQVRTRDNRVYVFAAPPAVSVSVQTAAHKRGLWIERIEDRCGNCWRFERTQGQLTRIVESGAGEIQGRFITVMSQQGRIEWMELHDPETGENHPLTSYRYDAAGDLMAALDPLEAARTFEYAEHRMLRHTDRTGLSFHYDYDRQWRVVHAWGDGGLYDHQFGYDELLRETEVTDSLGYVSRIKFDEYRLPLCEIDPLDGVTVFEYDDFGRTMAVMDPMGLRTEYGYDECGNLLTLTRPDGSMVVSDYDAEDDLVAVTDPSGAVWRQRYDYGGQGLLQEQVDPLGASTRYEWDRQGQLLTQVDARGAQTRLAYDRHGHLATLTDPLGHVSRLEHDALGRLLRQADPLGQVTDYGYDGKGRLLHVLQPGGASVQCDYDAEDQLVHYRDESGAETRLEYVGIGQIGRRIQPDGHTVEYRYDTEEQLIGLTNQRGERYELRRDALGRIVEEVDYWGQSRHYDYDAAGWLKSTQDSLGQRIVYQTDRLGRIVGKTLPDVFHPGGQVHETFKYDKRGQLVELRNPARRVQRRFDAAGRLLEEVQDGFRAGYQYDEAGNRIAHETSAGNRVVCAYDLRNQVVGIAINDDAPITLERDTLGRTTKEQLSDTVQRQFQYDARSLLTAQTVLGEAGPLFETRYDYDKAGNLTGRSDSQQGRDEYQYDMLGRLLQHTDPTSRIARYMNDPAGDRLQMRVRQMEAWQVAGGAEQPTQWTREGSYEGVDYVFDRAGNLVRRGHADDADDPETLQLVWDANHRLAESRKGGQVTTYGYDPLGRRVFKRNPTHTMWFYWDGDALLGEVEQANDDPEVAPVWMGNVANLLEARQRREKLEALHARVREYVYYPGSVVPLALIDGWMEESAANDAARAGVASTGGVRASAVYHYHVDPDGCPTRVTRGNGEVVWSASNEAWGRRTAEQQNEIHNPLRLQGQYYDLETELHCNRYRYYDPGTGSFISHDPIGLAGGPNAYQFAPNVIRRTDPFGLACGDVLRRDSGGQWIDANGRFVKAPPRPSYVVEPARYETEIPVTHTGWVTSQSRVSFAWKSKRATAFNAARTSCVSI